MEIVGQVLVLLHLIGFAALFGGLLVQGRAPHPEVNATMLYGAWIELVTGAGLVALVVIEEQVPHYAQLAVKLALTLFIVLLVAVNRKFESIPRGLWALIGLMTLINAGLAVLWQ
ncbi:MAG: hypothetical protein ABWY56_08705 [Propionibacteriaceae bacterium]